MFYISYKQKNKKFVLDANVNAREIPSRLAISKDGRSFCVGCSVDVTPEELFASEWRTDPRILNETCSALYIVHYDENGCTFATDNSGRELIFCYHSDDCLVLSDSFWGILKIIQPSYDDLDPEIVAEMIASAGGVPCDNATPIKGLFWLPVNTICSFDACTGEFTKRVYADTKRTCEITSLNEAVESFDWCMGKMASYLAREHAGERFGLGLSGGLDSRVALHYLEGAGIRPTAFNLCVTRPHKLFLATSVLNARSLARAAHADYREVEWRPETVRVKMDAMLIHNPLGTCGHSTNAYKYETQGLPEFDVLVTAGQAIGPNLVGGTVVSNADTMSKEEVFDCLYTICTGDILPYAYTEGLVRGKLNAKRDGAGHEAWEEIITTTVTNSMAQRIRCFIDDRYRRGFTAADTLMDYRTSALGAIGRDGAYESLFGTKRSYTIYTPFLVREGLKWDVPLVKERLVLKELIKRKIPEFAEVGEETYGGLDTSSKLRSGLGKLVFLLRGSGIMAQEWYARHPAIREAFLEDMTSQCEWFFAMFPCTRKYEEIWQMSPSRRNAVWELKRLIDCIETKRYLSFE